jgi:hypothetical protein
MKRSRRPRSPRARRALLALALALPLVLACVAGACTTIYVQPPGTAPALDATLLSVVYLIGDFGRPAAPFEDLVAAIGADVDSLAAQSLRTPPFILELGDNLYEQGLPHDLDGPGAAGEVDKLRALAAGFAGVRRGGAQVPLVLVPGNHDYADNALELEGNRGDISRWYFLDELGIEGTATWTHLPGDASGFASAAALFAHIDGNPDAHARFMAPVAVPGTGPEIAVVALDSQLLLDLYATDNVALAAEYWGWLDEALDRAPPGAWLIIAAHHPPVSYGKHGRAALGNWIFGQGWPQFPTRTQKVLAALTPLAVVLGVVVHPAAAAIAAVPPLTTWFVTVRKQDLGSSAYQRYSAALLAATERHAVSVILSGHDHNTQIIDLGATGAPATEDAPLLVITGAGSKVDPVRRGPGTLAFLADYSWVRMSLHAGALSFEVRDRRGELRYRHVLRR